MLAANRPKPPHGIPNPGAEDRAWIAVASRDRAADGAFWFGVTTTGVYCRPSCGARTPKRANVRFFASPEAARAAGFRACKRCRPDEAPHARVEVQAVTAAVRAIEAAISLGDKPPLLEALAARAGYSPHHFHRLFRRATGLTPGRYAAAIRAKAAHAALAAEPTVTGAIYAAGYASPSRFYEAAGARLGMAPAAARRGGPGETIRFVTGPCSLGEVLVAATGRGVCAVLLGDDAAALVADLAARFPRASITAGDDAERRQLAGVIAVIEAPSTNPHLPLDVRGTAFQERVWQALRRIRPGTTATYAGIAAAIGRPSAARAVAGACAANPAAVLIPCHRVVGSGGDLSGYRWGPERKAELLRRERRGQSGSRPD
jgi:AraC family transcriptional regulator of adaptative response/methylated-DNA-[protein]-cysteine methyltransferase